MFDRTPSGPPPDQRNDQTWVIAAIPLKTLQDATSPATQPPDEGFRISPKALRILATCALGIVALWAAVELAKLGADPTVLPAILKFFKP
ncbi:hypothetical protein [Nonomuraea angiospora]|uniref:hypothetical protein n=1 Tax=Nonomuraea angiospora TaxID=46172 RepID=UPI0029A8F7E5|nr:hypothetical protein [Nonomuraea angiospora]MDX3101092.1 hypothetical protein [Nonomuraea angiospora]